MAAGNAAIVDSSQTQRKFINPTPGWVGANIFDAEGKKTSIPVEPGGEVWLTPAEERMTADNPFVKEWEEPVDYDTNGEVVRTVMREGVLQLADEDPRPIASDRFIPGRQQEKPTVDRTIAPPHDPPPVQGHGEPGEVMGTPEATAANREALAQRQPTPEQPKEAEPTVTAKAPPASAALPTE